MISTHNLLLQLKHGEEQAKVDAFASLYQRHIPEFFRYALAQGLSREDAEDAVEETFNRILTCISNYNEVICGGKNWMWSICRHQVTDIVREKQKRPVELFETHPSSEDTNPEVQFEKQERLQNLSRAWEKLSPADQQSIWQGRGRGPGRKAWHEAMQRLRAAFPEEY